MAAPFVFNEQIRTEYYHAIRIYICGADVTPYVNSSVSLQYQNCNGVNSCSFTLTNAMRCLELTQTNLKSSIPIEKRFRLTAKNASYQTDGMYSEEAKYSIYKYKIANNLKHAVQSFGPTEGSQTGSTVLSQQRDASSASSTTTDRYPMNEGSLIFHKYDPVRVFVLNPLSHPGNTATTEQWYCVFTGYLDSKPYSQDFVSGLSNISVTCQDIRLLMQGMRTQMNPSVQYGNENSITFLNKQNQTIEDSPSAGFFNDLIAPGANISHVLGGKTFTQSIQFLIFGIPQVVGPATSTKSNLGAVGKLQQGVTQYHDPRLPTSASDLESWNNLLIFGSNKTFISRTTMIKMGEGTTATGNYSPDSSLVHFLFPASGAPTANLVEYSFDAQVNAKADWATRLDLIRKICKSIDYEFYVTGYGDLVFEFPMYDFLPSHYGNTFNKVYTFDQHMVSDNINDEGGDPISGLVIQSSFLMAEFDKQAASSNTNTGVANSAELKRTIYSNVMASRIGVHIETQSVPGVRDQNRLAQLGLIEFAKRVSNFDRFDMVTSYRPFLTINRPIYYLTKKRIGIAQTVSYSWKIRGEVDTSISLGFTRKQESDGAFRFITGGEATPISYNTIYGDIMVPGQGVNVNVPVKGVPTSSGASGGN